MSPSALGWVVRACAGVEVARAGASRRQRSPSQGGEGSPHSGLHGLNSGNEGGPEMRGDPQCPRARPRPQRMKRDCAWRGQLRLDPNPRAPERCARGRADGRQEVLGLLPAGRGRLPVSPRPRELTFTKLSASGNPGSTISSSDLAALDGALDSRGLGGAIFPACTALLARAPESTRRACTAHVQRPF